MKFCFLCLALHILCATAIVRETFLTPSACADLRKTTRDRNTLPCECRSQTGTGPLPCHPRCCPRTARFPEGDRCHEENYKTWTVYEQMICRPPTSTQNVLNDGVCWQAYGAPNQVMAKRTDGNTQVSLSFLLSLKEAHYCVDLVVSQCSAARKSATDVLLRLGTGGECWVGCPVTPYAPCTASSCLYNRGRTHPFIREWTGLPALPSGNYALVCQSIAKVTGNVAGQTEVNQTLYSSRAFYLP